MKNISMAMLKDFGRAVPAKPAWNAILQRMAGTPGLVCQPIA